MDDSLSYKIFRVINLFFLIFFAFVCVYPFYYMFIYSFSEPNQALKGNVIFLPQGFTLNNFQKIFQDNDILHAAFISGSRVVVGTVYQVLTNAFFAYLITQKVLKERFRKIIFRMVIMTMYMSAGLIPTYLMYRSIGLRNNFLVYILPGTIIPFFIILVKTFIEGLPDSLQESALLDGAGYIRIFFSIIFPVCLPVIASISIFAAVGQWSNWQDNYFYAPDRSLTTLQYLLYQYLQNQVAMMMAQSLGPVQVVDGQSVAVVTTMSAKTTITVIVTIPVLVIYPVLQKYFISGLLLGAVKE